MSDNQWVSTPSGSAINAEMLEKDSKEEEENMVKVTAEKIKVEDTAKDAICPFCLDKIAVVWDEDQDDWIYENAVRHSSDICHCVCIEEVLKNREK